MINRMNSRLHVEALEDRQLMAANLASSLGLHAAPVNQAALYGEMASQPMGISYGSALKSSAAAAQAVVQTNSALSIVNNSKFNLTFNIRWHNANGTWSSWQSYTLYSHYQGEYSYSAVGYTSGCLYNGPVGLDAQICFAPSTRGGSQVYTLHSSASSGKPAMGAGPHYQFLTTSSTTVNLYTSS